MADSLYVNAPDSKPSSDHNAAREIMQGSKFAQTPEEVYQLVRERFESAQAHKYWLERQWVLNIAHYMGQPNVGFDRRTGAVAIIPKDSPQRVRVSDPIIPYLIDTRKARILRAVPEPVVLPASTADDDRYKAKLATKIVKYLLDKYDYSTTLSEQLILFADVMSVGFLKVTFDPLKGDHFQQVEGQDEQGAPTTQFIPEGEIKLECVTPFAMFVDPASTTLDDARWVIEAHEIPIKEALRLFPGFEQEIVQSVERSEARHFALSGGFNVLYEFPQFAQVASGNVKDRVVFYEMWERGSAEFPTGRHVVMINRHILMDEPTPEEYDEIPYEMVSSFPVPGRFWPVALTEYLVPLQVEYNRRRSQIMENLNAHAWLRVISPRGALVNSFTKDAHHVWEFDPLKAKNFEPKVMQIPSMPPEAFKQLQDIKGDMEELAGTHDVSRGENPTNARTGRAMWFLQEADDTRLERVVQRYHSATEGVCTRMLKLAKKFYTRERIAYTFVPHDVEIMEFTGSELGENTRVVIDPRARAPLSMSQRIDLFLSLYEQGAIVDKAGAPSPRKLLELMNLQSTDQLFEDDSLHRARARKENLLNRQMQPIPPPGPFEDHEIHLDEHRRETLMDSWFQLVPLQQQEMLFHIFQHEIAQLREMEMKGMVPPGAANQAMAMKMPNAPGNEMEMQSMDVSGSGSAKRPDEPHGAEEQKMQPNVGDRGMDKNRDQQPSQPGTPATPSGSAGGMVKGNH